MAKRITPEEAAELKNNYIKFYDSDYSISLTTEVKDELSGELEQQAIKAFVFDNAKEIAEDMLVKECKTLSIELGAHEDGTFAPIIRVVSESGEPDGLFEWSMICPPYCPLDVQEDQKPEQPA